MAGCGLFCGLDLSFARAFKCNLVGPVVFCYACGVLDFVLDFQIHDQVYLNVRCMHDKFCIRYSGHLVGFYG